MDLSSLVSPIANLLGSMVDPDRRQRRLWVSNGRAHIEVRGLHRSDTEGLREQLSAALEALDAVHWAQVNAITGRLAVVFDGDAMGVDDLVEVIEGIEEAHGVDEERFPAERPEHPGDTEPLRRNLAALAADVVGLGASTFGQILQATPIPAELASLVTLVESTPRVRRVLEGYLGHPTTDFGLALANAIAQALGQGPAGLVVDIANRLSLITEIRARQASWAKRESELCQRHHGPVTALDAVPRPAPLPPGPIERYTDRASLASLGAFGLTWALTANPRLASNAVMAGLPKAARMGREGFASQMGRVLADRGVVILDPGVLRRLDRIDTVVVDAAVLSTGRWSLGEAVGMGPLDAHEVRRQAQTLFDADQPSRRRSRGPWMLAALNDLSIAVPKGAETRARPLAKGRTVVLGLARDDILVGLVAVVAELDPLAQALADAVTADGHSLIVAGPRGGVARRLGAEATVAGGRRMADAVRALQQHGRAVAVVGRDSAALRAADCGIATMAGDGPTPWGADLVCGADLAPACLVMGALAVARRTSRLSASLALAGSAAGAAWALVGPRHGAGRRALLPVNGAALLAVGSGAWAGIGMARQRMPTAMESVAWHELEPGQVLVRLGTSMAGLDATEVLRRKRAAEYTSSPGGASSLGVAVLDELATPLTPVLAVGAALSAAVGSLTDAWLVGGVVGANALISAAERRRTERALQRLLTTSATLVRVRRDNQLNEAAAEDVVVGDVVCLSAGEVVPGDCRIMEAAALEVDESSLTGESVPVHKEPAVCVGASVAERACMLHEGTTVVAGTASAVVVAVGQATEAGRAIDAFGQAPPTGVEARLRDLTTKTVPWSVAAGIAVAGLSVLRRGSAQAAISSGVGLMVASVPEGLPLLASVAQLAAARRLAARNALVRNPSSIEALGRVDTLCFDKTGTLTEGMIALRRVSDGRTDEEVGALGPRGVAILRVALRATPTGSDGHAVPHATDQALLEGAADAAVDVATASEAWVPVAELPFEAARGFHAVVGQVDDGHVLAVKGAPEVLLPRCRRWTVPGQPGELDGAGLGELHRNVERLGHQGLRVLAVAQRPAALDQELNDDAVEGLDLIGFVALADAVRPTAGSAVAGLRRAGVEVAMITGDHPSTAAAIAAELGILNGRRILTGGDLDALDDPSLVRLLPEVSVFARVTPAHKVRIVEGLQRGGRIVAMTGDGANDAPAIRLAHAGIALGQRGAAPAREAADLVVTDDRIETLIEAIVEGRAMWASVRDALAILVGGNVGEVLFTLAGTAITGRSPLNARQLLVVNLLTDLLPAMAIALRPPAGMTPEALLHEGPEASLGAALGRDIAWRAVTTAAGAGGAWAVARATGPASRASTVSLVALVGTQLGQTVVSGGTSPLVVVSSLVSGATLAAIVQVPGLSQFFGCTPLDPLGWATAIGAASAATTASVMVPAAIRVVRHRAARTPAEAPA